MTILHAIVLGLVQGLGEFLPVSSSAHLVLVPWLLGWPESGINFDVALHIGTLIAVTIYFWRDLLDLAIQGLTKGTRTPSGRIGWGIVLGTLPAVLIGFPLKDQVERVRSPLLIAVLMAVMGVVLYWADQVGSKRRQLDKLSIMDILWIGVGQAAALIPGVSRSGATITTALLLGLERESAARISFLLGWPAIFGAGILALKDMGPDAFNAPFFIGVGVSAVSGYAVIAFLLDYLRRGSLKIFAWYRLAVAALTVAVYFIRKG